jgi:hypothetical protein
VMSAERIGPRTTPLVFESHSVRVLDAPNLRPLHSRRSRAAGPAGPSPHWPTCREGHRRDGRGQLH